MKKNWQHLIAGAMRAQIITIVLAAFLVSGCATNYWVGFDIATNEEPIFNPRYEFGQARGPVGWASDRDPNHPVRISRKGITGTGLNIQQPLPSQLKLWWRTEDGQEHYVDIPVGRLIHDTLSWRCINHSGIVATFRGPEVKVAIISSWSQPIECRSDDIVIFSTYSNEKPKSKSGERN